MFRLVENEVFKILLKKRLLIILAITVVMIFSFSYGQKRTVEHTKQQLAQRTGISMTDDWKKLAEQQLIEMKDRLERHVSSERRRAYLTVRMEQLKYSIDNDINPVDISSAKFTVKFMEQAVFLLLPLLIIMLAADMVSSEYSDGTVKLLLTRHVPRWKILLSKYIALVMMETVVMVILFTVSVAVSGIFFGYGGWDAPAAVGFILEGDRLDSSGVMNVPMHAYALMVYSLAFYVALTVGTISFMISVLVRSTAVSIGVMMSALIGGSFMGYFLPDWPLTRYMFMVNLRLPDYLSGSFQPVPGMTLLFSAGVLAAWALLSLAVSFVYFIRKDILV